MILICDLDAKSLMAFFSLNEWLGTVTRDRFVTIGNFNNFWSVRSGNWPLPKNMVFI